MDALKTGDTVMSPAAVRYRVLRVLPVRGRTVLELSYEGVGRVSSVDAADLTGWRRIENRLAA